MKLAEAAWPDVADADPTVALVPVGSTEQHGPHAPLSTDTVAAAAVAEAAVERTGVSVAVAPPIPVGISAEHRHFAGTMWVSPDTFRAYVREAAESLGAQGADRVVFVNGHGGNTDALREVAAGLTRAEDGPVDLAAAFTWFDAVDEPDMGHAGPVETSLMLAVASHRVHEDRLADAAAEGASSWGAFVNGTAVAYDTAAFSPNGTVGDPTDADAARGDELLDAAAAALGEVVTAVADRDPDALVGPVHPDREG
ncbi:MAG: creatininase family protein [Halobacteriaceae archaeon]